MKLTAVAVEKLKPPAAGQIEYFDQRLPAFGLRLSYHGTKSWFVMSRLDGKLIRTTLGKYPALSLASAREEARKTMNLVAAGKDPRLAKIEARQKRLAERRNTFKTGAATFLEVYAGRHLRASTQREYQRILTGPDTQSWLARPITEITKRDVLEVIDRIDGRGSPGASRRALSYLRKFFNWCAEQDIITVVPTDRIRSPRPEVKRDRVLSEEELRYLLRALDEEESIFEPLVRILLLTGQRRAEVAGMRWSELRDFEGSSAIWELSGERTKNKRSHLVPLAPMVRDLIDSQPHVGELVFTTTGETPVSGFGKVKKRLDKRINEMRISKSVNRMPPWTLHDLRRTMVTVMNEKLGIQPHIVEAVVNHASGLAKAGVAGVYNRALYLEERRSALFKWSQFLIDIDRTSHF